MTPEQLRDHFAAQAMAALIVAEVATCQDRAGYPDVVAEAAYLFADAMLRARLVTPDEAKTELDFDF